LRCGFTSQSSNCFVEPLLLSPSPPRRTCPLGCDPHSPELIIMFPAQITSQHTVREVSPLFLHLLGSPYALLFLVNDLLLVNSLCAVMVSYSFPHHLSFTDLSLSRAAMFAPVLVLPFPSPPGAERGNGLLSSVFILVRLV